MNWTCVTVVFREPPDDWSAIHDVFERNGAPGTVERDDPPAISAYLVSGSLSRLGATLLDAGADRLIMETFPEENWAESWKQYFHPRPLGYRFMVVPSWEEAAPHDRELTITLDPGQAFGTGDHPTTAMCVALLEQAVRPGAAVLDIGTGSGILTIAASMLGAARIVATEVDPVALATADANLLMNHVAADLLTMDGVPDGLNEMEVVVSNIVSAVLIRLAADVSIALKPGGLWIVSGIIADNWPDVESRAEECGFETQVCTEDSGWVAGLLRKASMP